MQTRILSKGRHVHYASGATLAMLSCFLPMVSAHAAAVGTGGGGMPYSTGINTLSVSVQTEVAALIIIICVVCGVGAYIMQGQLVGLMETIGRVIVGISVVGGVASMIALAGITGAVV